MQDDGEEIRMEPETPEERVEERISDQLSKAAPKRRGWRWFVGIDANNLHFEEAVRLGQEWRFADRPKDESESA